MNIRPEILKKYHELAKHYKLRQIFEFLNLLRDSGIVNMFGASPFLYGGKEFLEGEIKRHKGNSRWWSDDEDEDDEEDDDEEDDNKELINMADQTRNLMIQGVMDRITNQDSENLMRNVKRKLEIDAREITQIWGNFKGKVMRESNIKKSTNFIKEILKEETSLQTKMLKLIQDRGLIIASKLTGGINRLASVLKETPETLLTKYLSKETFSTDDIEKNTGGYNFKFKLLLVKKSEGHYGEHEFVFSIEEGTVELIMTDDDTEYNLFGNYIRELESWWEIKYEIQDILSDFAEELTDKLKFDDVKSVSINFIFKGRDQFNYINEEEEKTNTKQKLEDTIKKAIDNFTKNTEFPENFLKFDVLIRTNKQYNEKELIITTIMKKEFSGEELDKLYDIRFEFIPKIKAIFKGVFKHIYYNSTTTLDMFNRDKEKREKFGLF